MRSLTPHFLETEKNNIYKVITDSTIFLKDCKSNAVICCFSIIYNKALFFVYE